MVLEPIFELPMDERAKTLLVVAFVVEVLGEGGGRSNNKNLDDEVHIVLSTLNIALFIYLFYIVAFFNVFSNFMGIAYSFSKST